MRSPTFQPNRFGEVASGDGALPVVSQAFIWSGGSLNSL